MSLRLVASDGVLVDGPTRTVPNFQALSRRSRDVLYMLTIGDVTVAEDGLFTMRSEQLARALQCSKQVATKAIRELHNEGFIDLVEENRGRRPRVWHLHDRWNPSLELDQRARL